MRVLLERMRQHPWPEVHRRFRTICCTHWQTSAVIGTVREAFWHPRRFRRNLVMVSMDIRQCFDHMDTCRVVAALQAIQLPRWLVTGVARELCHLKAIARKAHVEWTPEFGYAKKGKRVMLTHWHYSTSSSTPFLITC